MPTSAPPIPCSAAAMIVWQIAVSHGSSSCGGATAAANVAASCGESYGDASLPMRNRMADSCRAAVCTSRACSLAAAAAAPLPRLRRHWAACASSTTRHCRPATSTALAAVSTRNRSLRASGHCPHVPFHAATAQPSAASEAAMAYSSSTSQPCPASAAAASASAVGCAIAASCCASCPTALHKKEGGPCVRVIR